MSRVFEGRLGSSDGGSRGGELRRVRGIWGDDYAKKKWSISRVIAVFLSDSTISSQRNFIIYFQTRGIPPEGESTASKRHRCKKS